MIVRLRRAWHRIWAGHEAEFYIYGGFLSGAPYVGCYACNRRRQEHRERKREAYEGPRKVYERPTTAGNYTTLHKGER